MVVYQDDSKASTSAFFLGMYRHLCWWHDLWWVWGRLWLCGRGPSILVCILHHWTYYLWSTRPWWCRLLIWHSYRLWWSCALLLVFLGTYWYLVSLWQHAVWDICFVMFSLSNHPWCHQCGNFIYNIWAFNSLLPWGEYFGVHEECMQQLISFSSRISLIIYYMFSLVWSFPCV